ncbi:MAG TPA: transcription antitermination factor NusB [Thermoanaerobaculia bacterium]|nr:transcription antitermination factor NusB [Thermoanaerobaculia bacterium]
MVVGKRRTAREMAVQMLYQRDLGGSALPQIFASFDPLESLAADGGDEDAPAAPKPAAVRRNGSEPLPAADSEKGRRQLDQAFTYARTLVEGALSHLDEIDELIRSQADNWRLERMPAVDRNILRLAVFEMLYEKDIPKLVVVDEAIELAKKFGSEQSSRFVNGLLDGLLKHHDFPGSLK